MSEAAGAAGSRTDAGTPDSLGDSGVFVELADPGAVAAGHSTLATS
ncbi:MAG: hypothetical protein Q7W56_04700 [Candidatus Latescibacteria bacterium]|nr:hypothetical protein [Candidatus Latescibacterota bacterium]